MKAEQVQYAEELGFATPGVVGGEIGEKADTFPQIDPIKRSSVGSHTVADSPHSFNESDDKALGAPVEVATTAVKSKRVRTGCLTCRSRHLKCDEGTPVCQNCRKSNRECERGVRLNFIDTTTPKGPMYLIPPTRDWHVSFQDESREIAVEYKGGLDRYATLPDKPDPYDAPQDITYDFSQSIGAPAPSHQSLPSMGTVLPAYQEPQQPLYVEAMNEPYQQHHGQGSSATTSQYAENLQPPPQSFSPTPTLQAEEAMSRHAFSTSREVLFMQVFVEEVAIWMDSMDAEKHFSELLPFQSLHQPMLRYSFLACGARHMNRVNPTKYPEDEAVEYYAEANQLFLRMLQNPDRDTGLCATTAVILNVYEVMTEKAQQRMNHIAGSRALLKECKWNARSFGIARACFFLNVGLELFSCLHFNWQVAWDPDDWGIDMTMNAQTHGGNEEAWTHKILYILAKVANFRATIPRFREETVAAQQARFNNRLQLWTDLRSWCDRWHDSIPPTMRPMAYVNPYQATPTKSSFPEVWLIKRPAIIARMFYHSAMTLLGAHHPNSTLDAEYKQPSNEMMVYHSRQICSIVAHTKDRGVGSASIRCLAIAAEHLTDRREQEEVLEIFARIERVGGWQIRFVNDELHEKWGWNKQHHAQDPVSHHSNNAPSFYTQGPGQASMPPLPQQLPHQQQSQPQPSKRPPSGIVNPLYRNADFSNPDAPYKNYYVPPTLPPLTPHLHLHSHPPPPSQPQHHHPHPHQPVPPGLHTGTDFRFSSFGG